MELGSKSTDRPTDSESSIKMNHVLVIKALNNGSEHRWELPVLHYHSIRGNNYYPFWGVIVSVIFHNFIRQTYHKISQIVTFFPHNGKLPDLSYKLPHFIFSDVLSILIFSPKTPEQCIKFFKILQFLEYMYVLIENDCFSILE